MKKTSSGVMEVIKFVAWANILYFFVEFYFARTTASTSLLSDSIDFLEDGAINFLILFAAHWHFEKRQKFSRVLAGLILLPSLFTFYVLVNRFFHHQVPEGVQMGFVGAGAFIVNAVCAVLLVRYRNNKEGVIQAAFLSSRNDLLANIAIIGAGFLTTKGGSYWPDFVVGVFIFMLNATAAVEVWNAAKTTQS